MSTHEPNLVLGAFYFRSHVGGKLTQLIIVSEIEEITAREH